MPKEIAVASYKKLLADISSLYEGARKTLIEAYWKIGEHIVRVEQRGEIKAAYGTGLLTKLSRDLTEKLGLGFSTDNLLRMRKFYLAYPKTAPARKLDWTHFVELLKVGEGKRRLELESRAFEEGLSSKAVRELVRQERVREEVAEHLAGTSENLKPVELLTPPKDLRPRTYKKTERGFVDCGFCVYRSVGAAELKGVTLTEKPAYVYDAEVERVIDVGFGTRVREKLRLRDIDCPELGSSEGEAAKRFVQKALPVGAGILLKTTQSDDKYGRYVADILYRGKDGAQAYLNNELLQNGLAVRVKD